MNPDIIREKESYQKLKEKNIQIGKAPISFKGTPLSPMSIIAQNEAMFWGVSRHS